MPKNKAKSKDKDTKSKPKDKSKAGRKPTIKSKKGFSVKTFKGMTKKSVEQQSGGFSRRVPLRKNETVPIQFLEGPEDCTEFEVHAWQEDGSWAFVPCAGSEACPLCHSDSDKIRRTSYRFLLNAFNLEAKEVQILEGPRTLANAIFYRFQRKPGAFLKRTFEVTRFGTSPVTYNFELGEDPVVKTEKLKLIDHDDYLIEEMKRYYGDELPEPGATSLDDDEDDDDIADDDDDDDEDLDDDEEEDDEEEEDDDDSDEDEDDDDSDDDDEDEEDDEEDDDEDEEEDEEEDEDEDDDDDDEEEDDEPPAKSKSKSKSTKTPAKKAAPKKTAPASKAKAKGKGKK